MTNDIDFKRITIDDDDDDEQIISRALAWAIAAIKHLPDDVRTMGDVEDMEHMRAILYSRVPRDTADDWVTMNGIRFPTAQKGSDKA